MHKNLSGKTEWASHTRNTAKGKRGVNKAERKVQVPSEDEPAFKRRKKRKRVAKPWKIEMLSTWNRRWFSYSEHETVEQRDAALAKAKRTYAALGLRKTMFRTVDPPAPSPTGETE
jgi:hypothetical protein